MAILPKMKLRVISGNPAAIEHQLNDLLDEYAATTWNFSVVGDEVRITVVLIAQSEIRKLQLASVPMPIGGRH